MTPWHACCLTTCFSDIRVLGHDNKPDLVEELLTLMARDKHSPEVRDMMAEHQCERCFHKVYFSVSMWPLQVQESFAACALDVKSVFDGSSTGRPGLEWSAHTLSHVTSLLLRANRTQQAWWEHTGVGVGGVVCWKQTSLLSSLLQRLVSVVLPVHAQWISEWILLQCVDKWSMKRKDSFTSCQLTNSFIVFHRQRGMSAW